MMNNREIYDLVREVPDSARKQITSGRMKGKTDISPMWRIEKLTEVFGPCGIGWWYVIKDQRLEKGTRDEIKAFVDIDLYYKWGETISQPIPGIGGNSFVAQESKGPYTNDECFKMALTDAISVAAKALGVGADVYMGGDNTKYSSYEDGPAPNQQRGLPPLSAPQNGQQARQQRQPPAQQRQAPAPQSQQQTPYFTCARCGKKLTPYNDSNGRQVSLRAHAEKSQQVFGEILCLDCMNME